MDPPMSGWIIMLVSVVIVAPAQFPVPNRQKSTAMLKRLQKKRLVLSRGFELQRANRVKWPNKGICSLIWKKIVLLKACFSYHYTGAKYWRLGGSLIHLFQGKVLIGRVTFPQPVCTCPDVGHAHLIR